jgi:hypothetical protein
MPSIALTDQVGKPVDIGSVNLSRPSSLLKYARAELLHLMVGPDFIALQHKPLNDPACHAIQFETKLANAFPIGTSRPAITFSPTLNAKLRATHDSASVEMQGSLDLGIGAAAGDISFGFHDTVAVSVGFQKAFPPSAAEPTLCSAVGQTLAAFVVPATAGDLALLQRSDIATVSGHGTLQVSTGFNIPLLVNPLASATLPLQAGAVQVKDGLLAGVQAKLTITGSYQIRARGLTNGAVELSYCKQAGVSGTVDFKASASASVSALSTDVLTPVLNTIATTKLDPKLLSGLTPSETSAFNSAIHSCVDHSLQASFDLALSTAVNDEVLFQYEIRPAALDSVSTEAVNRSLHGDLSGLAVYDSEPGAGVRVLNSVVSKMRTNGVSVKVNLIGILNWFTVDRLISQCEVLTDGAGSVTIKETAGSQRISAITEPHRRAEALRKALFDSVLVSTTCRASRAVALPTLHCSNLHFVVRQDANRATVADALNWFVALHLLTLEQAALHLARYNGGAACTCLLRTAFDDAACEALFFDGERLRGAVYYREFGRRALRALLHPESSAVDLARCRVLDDPGLWDQAVKIGPSPALSPALSMSATDPTFSVILGDIYDILWWADGMASAGTALLAVRQCGREDSAWQSHCDRLQQAMLRVVSSSRARFDEPWGMVSLFWSAGSPPTASGTLRAGSLSVTA